jgi:hypothetical protein
MTYYVNGNQVASGSQGGSGLGGRWALFSNEDAGPDVLLFNEPTGIYTHELYCASVAFADRVLNGTEITALGSSKASGIFASSFSPRPTLGITSSGGGNATVSWQTNYVGYALEQSDSLVSPQWKPVAGITNNSVTISADGAGKFYRLAQ